MTDVATHADTDLRLIEPSGGDHLWVMGGLITLKAGRDATGGQLTIAEMELPPGFEIPPHRHRDEDELFYVLDGEVTFGCDGAEATFTRGGMAWLPRRLAHTFRVSDNGPARLFNFHTGPDFEGLLAELGEPADELRLPDPPDVEPDPAVIAGVFARHGIDLVIPDA